MTTAVAAESITVHFGVVEALHEVTFSVPEAAFLAIIGPNGAGKTTLLRVLLGLERPERGKARLFGQPPQRFPAGRLGYVPQIKSLDRSFPAIALELVVTGLRRAWPWRIGGSDRQLALDVMQQCGVGHLADRPIAALSAGELQRVYLARSLVRQPALIVLDEPAAGMDIAGEAEMYHLLEAYQQAHGGTVVMITHDWEGARYHASHLLLLDKEVKGFGPPAEFGEDAVLLSLFGHTGHIAETHEGNGHA